MISFILPALFSFFVSQVNAGAPSVYRVAQCKLDGAEYAAFSQKPLSNEKALQVALIETRDESKMLTADMVLSPIGYKIKLPSYWPGAQELLPTNCVLSEPPPASRPYRNIFKMLTYFVEEGVTLGPNEKIDDLVKRGVAFPIRVTVLCLSDVETQTPSGCREITILDQIIPVDPH